jgi:predicted nuclease with TOPRIM domain
MQTTIDPQRVSSSASLREQLRVLRDENARMRDENVRMRAENDRLREENRAVRKRNAELRRALDAHISRARQTALFGPLELTAGTCVGPRRTRR